MERSYGLKQCIWCGATFEAHSARQQACKADHYRPCSMCGKPLLINESYQNYIKYGPRTCPECRKQLISIKLSGRSDEAKRATSEKRKQTNIERYGVAVPIQNPDIHAKIQATVEEKYGVANLSQSAEIQATIRKNSLAKYGVEHPSQDPEVRSRMVEGMVNKYGAESAMQIQQFRDAAKQTNLERYGVENVGQNKDVQDKMRQTSLERYGVEYPAQSDAIKQRRIATNYERYGAPGYVFSTEWLQTLMTDPSKADECEAFRRDPRSYILSHYSAPPTYKQLSKDLGIGDTSISYHVVKHNAQDVVSTSVSTMEQDVVDFIKSVAPDIEIELHNRQLIKPKELDIYLPQYHVAIECNPSASHNADIGLIVATDVLPMHYHQQKSEACQRAGIRLIHLFGYDWANHRSIMESIIRNVLNHNICRYYARKLHIKDISWKDCSAFLITNHRQGNVNSKVRLGLFDKDELVAVMTFNSMRPTQGATAADSENTWELTRFCCKLNCSVVGGASKLLKYFINTYNPDNIVSFSDISTTSGKLYQTLGFTIIRKSDPSYVWVDPNTEQYYNRVSCQKRNLKNLFKDDSIDIENLTEADIMLSHGFVRVYDSGLLRWELNLSKS